MRVRSTQNKHFAKSTVRGILNIVFPTKRRLQFFAESPSEHHELKKKENDTGCCGHFSVSHYNMKLCKYESIT